MVALPAFGTTSAPALRRPVFEIAFAGGGGGDEGGLAGAVASVASAVGVGGSAEDPWARSVQSVQVDTAMAPFVDRADIVLAGDSQAPDAAVGDEGTIGLGFQDTGVETVLSGAVEEYRQAVGGRGRLVASNGGASLSALRLDQAYEQQSAGDVVQDLAARAEVDTGTVEDGIDLPYYALDSRRNAYQHIALLARMSGYVAYFDVDGALQFVPAGEGDPVQDFAYGVDIIALVLDDASRVAQTVTLIGEGAAGSQGADAWSWLVKDPAAVSATAGSGARQRVYSLPALRSTEAVQAAANGAASCAALMTLTGRLTVAGAPAVTVAATFEITGAPHERMNGTGVARRVCHRYTKATGFVTVIDFWKAGEGGFAALGDALGGLL